MEPRKIIIVNSKTQKQTVLKASTAETLGQLKAELDELGVVHTGATFLEGRTKGEYKDDDAILPTNTSYKGVVTNELVFLLTTPEKKITSGGMSRQEVYEAIRKANLEEVCKQNFGKNFTLCKTTDLISLLRGKFAATVAPAKKEPVAKVNVTAKKVAAPIAKAEVIKGDVQNTCGCERVTKALRYLVSALVEDDQLDENVQEEIEDILGGISDKSTEDDGKLSKDALASMFPSLR